MVKQNRVWWTSGIWHAKCKCRPDWIGPRKASFIFLMEYNGPTWVSDLQKCAILNGNKPQSFMVNLTCFF